MSKNYLVILLFLLNGAALVGQSSNNAFRKLACSEKKWVLAHPFIAVKAFNCAVRSRFVTDSLEKNQLLKDGNGGQLDAFRHAYWMAMLTVQFSAKKAIRLGKVHEQGNYSDWKKGIQEDGFRADSMMCEMDLKNNLVGVELGTSFRKDTSKIKLSLTEQVLAAVRSGKLTIIKKNNVGQWLDEAGRIIDLKQYGKQWFIPKVLVRSDYVQPRN